MGVKIKLSELGSNIGPPQLNEYAVEPVGVEIIKPSAQYEFKKTPSTCTSMLIMDDESFFISVHSLSAKFNSNRLFGFFSCNKARASIVNCFCTSLSMAFV